MALDQSALLELLDALKVADVDDRIGQAATTIYQALIEAELTSVIGAAPHERTEARLAQRNGHRPKIITTVAGDLELRIPKLRSGSFFPSLLERRRRVDQSLFAVIMEAYLHGTSTRKVDDRVKALGADSGISKSEVSRICAELDVEIAAFRDRSLAEGTVAFADNRLGQGGTMRRRPVRVPAPRSSFAGFRFPPEVIMVAVRWYLRYGLSYRDVEEVLAERGITVDHVTIYRWVQRFTPVLIDAARPCRHIPGDRWFVDETYVKVAGRWVYLYRAIDQFGQVIDVLVSDKRDLAATRRFFTRALQHGPRPTAVSTDRAPAYPRVLDKLLPAACHIGQQYANNPIEADHGRLKARLRPLRGLNRLRAAKVISTGHAFVQNLRRGHYELGVDAEPRHRLPAAFAELALAI